MGISEFCAGSYVNSMMCSFQVGLVICNFLLAAILEWIYHLEVQVLFSLPLVLLSDSLLAHRTAITVTVKLNGVRAMRIVSVTGILENHIILIRLGIGILPSVLTGWLYSHLRVCDSVLHLSFLHAIPYAYGEAYEKHAYDTGKTSKEEPFEAAYAIEPNCELIYDISFGSVGPILEGIAGSCVGLIDTYAYDQLSCIPNRVS